MQLIIFNCLRKHNIEMQFGQAFQFSKNNVLLESKEFRGLLIQFRFIFVNNYFVFTVLPETSRIAGVNESTLQSNNNLLILLFTTTSTVNELR